MVRTEPHSGNDMERGAGHALVPLSSGPNNGIACINEAERWLTSTPSMREEQL